MARSYYMLVTDGEQIGGVMSFQDGKFTRIIGCNAKELQVDKQGRIQEVL